MPVAMPSNILINHRTHPLQKQWNQVVCRHGCQSSHPPELPPNRNTNMSNSCSLTNRRSPPPVETKTRPWMTHRRRPIVSGVSGNSTGTKSPNFGNDRSRKYRKRMTTSPLHTISKNSKAQVSALDVLDEIDSWKRILQTQNDQIRSYIEKDIDNSDCSLRDLETQNKQLKMLLLKFTDGALSKIKTVGCKMKDTLHELNCDLAEKDVAHTLASNLLLLQGKQSIESCNNNENTQSGATSPKIEINVENSTCTSDGLRLKPPDFFDRIQSEGYHSSDTLQTMVESTAMAYEPPSVVPEAEATQALLQLRRSRSPERMIHIMQRNSTSETDDDASLEKKMTEQFPEHVLRMSRSDFADWKTAHSIRPLSQRETKALAKLRRKVLSRVYANRARSRRTVEREMLKRENELLRKHVVRA